MLFKNINDIFEIAPPIMCGKVSNRQLPPEEMVYIETRGVTLSEKDADDIKNGLDFASMAQDKALENKLERIYKRAKEKFVALHNYKIPTADGGEREVTDFDDFRQVAGPELVSWYLGVIMSGESLSAAERKNFVRGSSTP
jgi:hypothetical protein